MSIKWLPSIVHCALCYGWLLSPISLLKQDDDTNQELSDDEREDLEKSTLSSDIEEDELDQQQQVLLLGQVRRDKSFRSTRVPLPTKRSYADTGISHPLLPNSRNPAGAMAPPLLKHQNATLLNKLSEADRAPSTQALPLCMSSGDQNVPQPKASANQNVPQHQNATFVEAK